jgi:hypothetical protein
MEGIEDNIAYVFLVAKTDAAMTPQAYQMKRCMQ